MTSRETRFDDRVAAALDDVPIPAGLAERLLAALGAPAGEALSAPALEAAPTPAVPRLALGPRRRHAFRRDAYRRDVYRRQWLTSVAACAAALLISAMIWWLFHPASNTGGDLPTLALRWADQLSDAWQPMKSTPAGFIAPVAMSAPPRGWQRATLSGRQTVAFDFSRPGLRAIVFVIRMVEAELPAAPPANPQLHTGGQSIGAWQSPAGTCVLVVEGDERAYRSLIRSGRTPMA